MCEIIFILFEVPKLMCFKFSLKIAMSDIRRSKKVPTLGKKIVIILNDYSKER